MTTSAPETLSSESATPLSGPSSGCLALVPCSITDARSFVARHHRHNKPPVSGLFAVAAQFDGKVCAVAIVGRPVARALDKGRICELTRLCSDGTANACSLLYGAAARAAKALGWTRIITYTLASEPGTSLRASGWMREAELAARPTWDCRSRARVQTNLFGEQQRPPDAKVRWSRLLTDNRASATSG